MSSCASGAFDMRPPDPPLTKTIGSPSPIRSKAMAVPSLDVMFSISMSSLRSSLREQLREPGLPGLLGLPLVQAVDEDVMAHAGRTAEHADVHEPVDPVIRANTQEVPGEPVHLAVEPREPFGRERDPVAELW